MNALSMELRTALADRFAELRRDRETRVVILTGAGRAFCAGLDLKEMGDPERSRLSAAELPDPPKLMRTLRQPIIGAINGVAVTGGFEIALSCDILIATPNARFADTHARVGLLAGWGLSQRLSRLVGVNPRQGTLPHRQLSRRRARPGVGPRQSGGATGRAPANG